MRNGLQTLVKVVVEEEVMEGLDQKTSNDGRDEKIAAAKGEARKGEETYQATEVKSDQDDRIVQGWRWLDGFERLDC